MAYDHYAVARSIAARLRSEGYEEWSKKLLAAIDDGSTGTEIFMALRWQLREFLKTKPTLSPATDPLIQELLAELDKALA